MSQKLHRGYVVETQDGERWVSIELDNDVRVDIRTNLEDLGSEDWQAIDAAIDEHEAEVNEKLGARVHDLKTALIKVFAGLVEATAGQEKPPHYVRTAIDVAREALKKSGFAKL